MPGAAECAIGGPTGPGFVSARLPDRTAGLDGRDGLDGLVMRVRNGDAGAFDEIMAATGERVLGLAWRLLGDRDSARDAYQEAFLRAFKSIG